MYSVKVFDHCPEFGGETIMLDFATFEDAQRVADREKAESLQYGLTISVTVIKNA